MIHTLVPTLLVVGALAALAFAGDESPRALETGDAAPAWRLNDQTGTARTLAESHKGAWVVLAFFPKAATPG
jgi:peroxiredoxin Q/BCP